MPNMKKKFSRVSLWHFTRLGYRSLLFIIFLVYYIICRSKGRDLPIDRLSGSPLIIALIWAVFMGEMLFRFFPSKIESPGCQKQFSKNYIPTGNTNVVLHDNNGTVLVALMWIVLNGIIGALYMAGIFDNGIMLLICLAYSVCDMICILFFCPFQTWFLKNKCCSACRIYNWDYAMMFTPLFFIRNALTWSLLATSVALLLRWEITVYRFPERFSENTNAYLGCANCSEKLCSHKTQLHRLWKDLNFEKKLREARILLRKL